MPIASKLFNIKHSWLSKNCEQRKSSRLECFAIYSMVVVYDALENGMLAML